MSTSLIGLSSWLHLYFLKMLALDFQFYFSFKFLFFFNFLEEEEIKKKP